MIARVSTIVAVVVAVALAACVDMSSPKTAPASVSAPQLPALFVVRGDVMRDSLGNPAKPSILMYDASGNAVTDFTPTFFLTDTNPAAHFNADGVLVGDRLGTVHLVAQVGTVQTTPLPVSVTVAPARLVASRTDTIQAPAGSDTAKSTGFQAAAATIRAAASDSSVQGLVVRYSLIRGLPSATSQPAVYIADDQGAPSLADTSDVSGTVSRRVMVVSSRLSDPALLSGQKTDSVVVELRAKYRGVDLTGSPLRLVFPVKVTFALK